VSALVVVVITCDSASCGDCVCPTTELPIGNEATHAMAIMRRNSLQLDDFIDFSCSTLAPRLK
jgi:hypothetical protein